MLVASSKRKGLFLAKGDKRGFVVVDHTEKVYSLSRHGALKAKEIKTRLGEANEQPSIALTNMRIRSIYTKEMLAKVNSLKNQHKAQQAPVEQKKAELIKIQRAERREQQDRYRLKRKATMKAVRGRFRKGVMGFFDIVSGRDQRIRLIGRKTLNKVKATHSKSRQKMIFRHNLERAELQKELLAVKQRHMEERKQLAKRILVIRAAQKEEQKQDKLRQGFEDSTLDKTHSKENRTEQEQKIIQTRKNRRRRELD